MNSRAPAGRRMVEMSNQKLPRKNRFAESKKVCTVRNSSELDGTNSCPNNLPFPIDNIYIYIHIHICTDIYRWIFHGHLSLPESLKYQLDILNIVRIKLYTLHFAKSLGVRFLSCLCQVCPPKATKALQFAGFAPSKRDSSFCFMTATYMNLGRFWFLGFCLTFSNSKKTMVNMM